LFSAIALIEERIPMGIIPLGSANGMAVELGVNSNPMDGKFEIILVKNLNTQFLINAGLSKFNDVFYMKENITAIGTEKAILKFDHPRLLQLDGEVIGKFNRLKVETIKGAIRLITSKDNQYVD